MNRLRRRSARRPYEQTQDGVRRIVLGAGGSGRFSTPPTSPARTAPADTSSSSSSLHSAARTPSRPPLRTTAPATRSLLAVVHGDRGQLDSHARQAVAAAALLALRDTAVHVLVFGAFDGDAAALGADTLTVVPEPLAYAPDAKLAFLLALISRERPEHIFLPDNALPDGDLGRRLAAALRETVAAGVIELNRDSAATPYQAGIQSLRRALPRILLLAPGAVDERLPFVGQGVRISALPLQTSSVFRDLGTRVLPPAEVALEEADLIVSAGNGVRDLDGFHALADALGAAVGASRVPVDDGRFARSQQIGATGKTVSASAYLAFGISGAVQHLQGIKHCRHVIAINRDASAPLIRRADLSIIDDTQRVAQALLARVREARGVSLPREAESAHTSHQEKGRRHG